MIEEPGDRQRGSMVTIHGSELAAWERLSFRFIFENLIVFLQVLRQLELLQVT